MNTSCKQSTGDQMATGRTEMYEKLS